MDELPDVFSSAALTSRLGKEAIVLIPPMVDPEFEKFVKAIIAHFRAPGIDVNKLIASAKASTTETLLSDEFPFTAEAIQKLKSNQLADMTPRDILLDMTKALGRAFLAGQPVIATQSVPVVATQPV
jgi:hypothetical protein